MHTPPVYKRSLQTTYSADRTKRNGVFPGVAIRQSSSGHLSEQRGDERYEAEIAARLGANGWDILTALNQIDDGQPRMQLIRLARTHRLSDGHLAQARLLALPNTERG
jgi:hypothetical protein